MAARTCTCGADMSAEPAWKHLCWTCYCRANPRRGYRQQQSAQPAGHGTESAGIPPDMLKRLIVLCHPDKHAGSDTANTVTAWLLRQR